jgi:hypothetical protein
MYHPMLVLSGTESVLKYPTEKKKKKEKPARYSLCLNLIL